MTPYCRRFITVEEIELFQEIRDAVNKMPDIDLGMDEEKEPIILSCHMLARGVAKVFPVRCVDGYFYPSLQHSWVVIPKTNSVIDVYPIQIWGGPFLVGGWRESCARRNYQKRVSNRIGLGRFSKPSFRRSVRRIAKALEEARAK